MTLDFDTFMPIKINTKLEFPNVIDLKEYSLNYVSRTEGKLNDDILEDYKTKLANPDWEEENEREGMTDEEKWEKWED